MSDRKFTDDEVIKALECCNDNGSCDNCPFDGAHNEDDPWCVDELNEATRTLINRQMAAIEEQNQSIIKALKHMGEIRANAYKEFAERLKANAEYFENEDYYFYYVTPEGIDTIVKEMTEGGGEG